MNKQPLSAKGQIWNNNSSILASSKNYKHYKHFDLLKMPTPFKYRPTEEASIKCRIIQSQIKMQQSFKQPIKCFQVLLTLFLYLQCLKYPIDLYSQHWFEGKSILIFSYLDVSHYMINVNSMVTAAIALVFVLFSVVVVILTRKVTGIGLFVVAKALQICFCSILFMCIISNACQSLQLYFINQNGNQTEVSVSLSIIALVLFTATTIIQTFLRFDFLSVLPSSGVVRTSNWSTSACLFNIVINQVVSKMTDLANNTHLILMGISFVVCVFIFFFKYEHEQELHMRIQIAGMLVNGVAILILVAMKLLNFQTNFGFYCILVFILLVGLCSAQFFNLNFELENVNKWTNSQIMIAYASKLRKVLLKYHDYHHETLFLGYFEIHQQKCDNENCPIRVLPTDDNKKQDKFEELIRKIYNDGCKLTPVNPQLQLEYAIFHYESGNKEKSLKMLLDIKQTELGWDTRFKYCRLKRLIHRELSELQHQDFLDLLSQIKINDLEQKILKKFQEVAFTNLQFWSVLNEDHPDFRKLLHVGKERVAASSEVNKLYQQITKIAHSQKIETLYIHYLTEIENDQKLFAQIYEQLHSLSANTKIVIEDWANNTLPILIVSMEEENYGTIIDLNTACAISFGYERYDILGKNVSVLFAGNLECQSAKFLNPQHKTEQPFYLSYKNGYGIKYTRTIHNYSSILTGRSVIITLEQTFVPNSAFILFNSANRLITMSASCIHVLDLSPDLLTSDVGFADVFKNRIEDISEEKCLVKAEDVVKNWKSGVSFAAFDNQKVLADQMYHMQRNKLQQFNVVSFLLVKTHKISNKFVTENSFEDQGQFSFEMIHIDGQYMFYGSNGFQNNRRPKRNSFLLNNQTNSLNKIVSQNYGDNISTLRLHQNYIKVIEQEVDESQNGENNSKASTNNELLALANISKKDEEVIFESRSSYVQFVDEYAKRMYLKSVVVFSYVSVAAIYIAIFMVLGNFYQNVYYSFKALSLQNQIIGEISSAQNLLLQTENRIKYNYSDIDSLLLFEYNERINHFQLLNTQYEQTYMLQVQGRQMRSDEFILAFISQLSSVRALLNTLGTFDGIDLNQKNNGSIYIQYHGNVTKNMMYSQVEKLKQNAGVWTRRAFMMNIILTALGISIALLMTVLLILVLKNANRFQVQILNVFLQISEKDIQAFSSKTENFLIILHVDDSNEGNDNTAEALDMKKGSMFAKKKSYKTTNFDKSPYVVLSLLFFFFSAYFVHSFVFNFQKQSFLYKAGNYLEMFSRSRDHFSSQQAKIQVQLNHNFGSNVSVYNSAMMGDINSILLTYEKDLFSWHYQTYGIFEDYHHYFSSIFMKDICNGEYKVNFACESGPMAENGTLLVLTDLVFQNEHLDLSKPLSLKYEYSFKVLKHSHYLIHNALMEENEQYFDRIQAGMREILIIWIIVTFFVVFAMIIYIEKFILKGIWMVKSMLKIFPISFARESLGVRRFVADHVDHHSFK